MLSLQAPPTMEINITLQLSCKDVANVQNVLYNFWKERVF